MSTIPSSFIDGVFTITDDGGNSEILQCSNGDQALTGVMPNGQTFSGFQELKGILKTSYRRQIIRNIVERTLSYALCRKLQLHDRPTVDEMVDALDSNKGTYRELIRLIVNSLPFRETFVKGESS